ncbi:MAG: hypothetical protein GY832_22505 [Chloroflexi bacterium]|nr:hypothetical protein [Chloroflexota bacterium]
MADPTRTVLHGIDQSVPGHNKLPSRGNHAAECLTDDLLGKHIWDDIDGKWKPMEYIAFEYDFDVHGGAVGFIDLDVLLPAGTIIVGGMLDVIEELGSAGAATIAIKAEAADDILAADTLDNVGFLGMKDVVPVNTAATAIKLTTDKWIKIDIRVAALTSGVIRGYLHCFRGSVDTGDEWSSSTEAEDTSSTVGEETSSTEAGDTSSTEALDTSSTEVMSTSSTDSSSSNQPA